MIDALGDLERCSMDRQRFADFMYALTQWFAVENVTCMMTIEMLELFEVHHISDQQISNMSDHDNRQHELEINDKGVVVKP